MRNALIRLAALVLLAVSLGLEAGDVVTPFLHSTTESLIVGLSLGTIVVAAQTSIGSMIFSRRARPATTRVTSLAPNHCCIALCLCCQIVDQPCVYTLGVDGGHKHGLISPA